MKIGDVIINPYVRETFGNTSNPLYKIMVVDIGTKDTLTLGYDGKIRDFPTHDCKNWEVSHHVDLAEIIFKERINDNIN